eukprot:6764532-Pyramimonas_sp.AAC.1
MHGLCWMSYRVQHPRYAEKCRLHPTGGFRVNLTAAIVFLSLNFLAPCRSSPLKVLDGLLLATCCFTASARNRASNI